MRSARWPARCPRAAGSLPAPARAACEMMLASLFSSCRNGIKIVHWHACVINCVLQHGSVTRHCNQAESLPIQLLSELCISKTQWRQHEVILKLVRGSHRSYKSAYHCIATFCSPLMTSLRPGLLPAEHRAWQASTACERELSAFMAVAALRRCSEPHRTSAMASSAAHHAGKPRTAAIVLSATFLLASPDWVEERSTRPPRPLAGNKPIVGRLSRATLLASRDLGCSRHPCAAMRHMA